MSEKPFPPLTVLLKKILEIIAFPSPRGFDETLEKAIKEGREIVKMEIELVKDANSYALTAYFDDGEKIAFLL